MNLETTLRWMLENWQYFALVLPFVLSIIVILLENGLKGAANQTVAAVYRAAIHAATELKEEGVEWVRSEDGINFRKTLAESAYDLLPARVGPVPVGLVKLVLSREKWVALVEKAFQEMVKTADRLEMPMVVAVEMED